jgi:hypothetical protein
MVGMNPSYCALHLATGREEECPGRDCAFWEDGGAVVEPACIFERVRLELDGRPAVAQWLLAIRNELESARTPEETRRIGSQLNAILLPGLHE